MERSHILLRKLSVTLISTPKGILTVSHVFDAGVCTGSFMFWQRDFCLLNDPSRLFGSVDLLWGFVLAQSVPMKSKHFFGSLVVMYHFLNLGLVLYIMQCSYSWDLLSFCTLQLIRSRVTLISGISCISSLFVHLYRSRPDNHPVHETSVPSRIGLCYPTVRHSLVIICLIQYKIII